MDKKKAFFFAWSDLPKYCLFLVPLIVLWVSNLSLYADLFDKAFLFNLLVEISGAIFLLLWAWGRLRPPRLRLNWIDLLLTGFVLALFLSTLFAYDPAKSFWGIFWRNDGFYQWLHYLLFYWLLRLNFSQPRDWLLWLRVNTLAAGFLSLGIILPALRGFIVSGALPIYAAGPLSNLNFLAYYLALSLILTLYLFLFSLRQDSWRLVYLLSGLLQLYPLWLTSGRTAYLATAVGVIWLLAVRFGDQIRRQKSLWGGLVILFLVSGFLVLGGVSRFGVSFKEIAIVHRFQAWKIGWEAFRERPLLGWGPENFSAAFNKYYRPVFEDEGSSNETWFDKAHNFVIEYLVVGGLVAALFYLALIVSLFRQGFLFLSRFKKKKGKEEWRPLAWAGLVGLTAHIILNFFGFDVIASAVIAIFLFALLASLGGGTSKSSAPLFSRPLWRSLALALFLILLGSSPRYTWQPWLIQRTAASELKEIRYETFPQELRRIESQLQRSSFIRRNFLPYLPLSLHQNWVRLVNFTEDNKRQELWSSITELLYRYRSDLAPEPTSLLSVALPLINDVKGNEEIFQRAQDLLEQVLSINPNRPYLYYYLAHLYALREDNERAHELLLKALSLNGKFDLARYQLVLINWALGNIEESDQFASQAQSFETLNNLAKFYAQNRELERLLKIYQQILAMRPNDLFARYQLGMLYVELKLYDEARREAEELKKNRRPEAQAGAYEILRLVEAGGNTVLK